MLYWSGSPILHLNSRYLELKSYKRRHIDKQNEAIGRIYC